MGIMDWFNPYWNAQSVLDNAVNPQPTVPSLGTVGPGSTGLGTMGLLGGTTVPSVAPVNAPNPLDPSTYMTKPPEIGQITGVPPGLKLYNNLYDGSDYAAPAPAIGDTRPVARPASVMEQFGPNLPSWSVNSLLASDNPLSKALGNAFSTTPTAQTAAATAPTGIMGTLGEYLPDWMKNTLLDKKTGGLNMGNIEGIMKGIGSAFGIYGGLKSLGMAQDQFDFQKDAYRENIANQKQTYNSTLEDRQRARDAMAGASEAETMAYVNKHKLR